MQMSCNFKLIRPLFKFITTTLLFLFNVHEMEKVAIKALTTKKEFA